jgi:hypothetical protein
MTTQGRTQPVKTLRLYDLELDQMGNEKRRWVADFKPSSTPMLQIERMSNNHRQFSNPIRGHSN